MIISKHHNLMYNSVIFNLRKVSTCFTEFSQKFLHLSNELVSEQIEFLRYSSFLLSVTIVENEVFALWDSNQPLMEILINVSLSRNFFEDSKVDVLK